MRLEGSVRTHSGGSAGVRTFPLIGQSRELRRSGSFPCGGCQLPFEVALRQEDRGGQEGYLPESYKGIWVNVEYRLTAEVRRAGLLSGGALSSSAEVFVERSPVSSGMMVGAKGRRRSFRLTPEIVAQRSRVGSDRRRASLLAKAPKFAFSGHLVGKLKALSNVSDTRFPY